MKERGGGEYSEVKLLMLTLKINNFWIQCWFGVIQAICNPLFQEFANSNEGYRICQSLSINHFSGLLLLILTTVVGTFFASLIGWLVTVLPPAIVHLGFSLFQSTCFVCYNNKRERRIVRQTCWQSLVSRKHMKTFFQLCSSIDTAKNSKKT